MLTFKVGDLFLLEFLFLVFLSVSSQLSEIKLEEKFHHRSVWISRQGI